MLLLLMMNLSMLGEGEEPQATDVHHGGTMGRLAGMMVRR